MSRETFADPEVRETIERDFALLELNVAREREAAAWLDCDGVPDVVILSPEGERLARSTGYKEAREFVAWLRDSVRR